MRRTDKKTTIVVIFKKKLEYFACDSMSVLSDKVNKSLAQLNRYKKESVIYECNDYTIYFMVEVLSNKCKGQNISYMIQSKP